MLVEFERQGCIGILSLNRPERLNALSLALVDELSSALTSFESAPDLWVGVLTAHGPVFSAGGDLKPAQGPQAGPRPTGAQVHPNRGGNLNAIITRARSKPLIAAVEGTAAAGGFELVLECDLVVASSSATFILPEVKRSLIAAAGGTTRLHQFLPRNIAMELLLTGRPLPAPEAYRWGLVNRLVDPGSARSSALTLAREICQGAPFAVRETRRAFLAACRGDEDEAWRIADEALAAVIRSADFAEGIQSFLEKREPTWTEK